MPEVLEEPLTDLLILMDSSGSMSGRYDFVKKGVRAALEVGQQDDIKRDYAITNFSEKTKSSGWISKYGVEELQPFIDYFQAGGTYLDINVLQSLTQEDRDYGVIVVTDGEMQNQEFVNEELRLASNKGNRVGIIFIGDSGTEYFNKMSEFTDVYLVNPEQVEPVMKAYTEFLLKGAEKPTGANF